MQSFYLAHSKSVDSFQMLPSADWRLGTLTIFYKQQKVFSLNNVKGMLVDISSGFFRNEKIAIGLFNSVEVCR